MSKFRDWWWEVSNYGPMYYFMATFDFTDADKVAAIAQDHPAPGIKWANHQLYIEAGGYGFLVSPSPLSSSQTDLIVTLLQTAELTIKWWKVESGGCDDPVKTFASGTSREELFMYLQKQ